MNLSELAVAYGTDKGSGGHDYMAVYEFYMHQKRHEAITLVEIGVDSGASMLMWRDYFDNQDARFTGIDINPAPWYEDEKRDPLGPRWDDYRMAFIQADVKDITGAKLEAKRRFDFVIDDGSHEVGDVTAAFDIFWPYIQLGGYFVIEDLWAERLMAVKLYLRQMGVGYMNYASKAGNPPGSTGQEILFVAKR